MRKLILSNLLIILIAISCEDSENGCLDIFSDNFNVNAVTTCDSCCTYPIVKTNFRLYYDSTSVKLVTDTLFFNNEDSLIIHDFKFLTSEYEFLGDNESYTIQDSILIDDNSIKDDFIYIDNLSSYDIGDIRFEDVISQITFRLGIDNNNLDAYVPFDQIDQDSRLDEALDSMYNAQNEKVAYFKMGIQLGDSIRQIELYDYPNLLSFNYNTEVSKGFAWTQNMRIELTELLKGITPKSTNEEISSAFKDNIESSLGIQ